MAAPWLHVFGSLIQSLICSAKHLAANCTVEKALIPLTQLLTLFSKVLQSFSSAALGHLSPHDRRLRRDGPVHTASDTGSTAGSSVGPSQGYGSADIPVRSLEGGTRSPGCLYPGHEDSSTRSPGCLYPRDEDSGNSSPACTTDGNTPSGSFPSI